MPPKKRKQCHLGKQCPYQHEHQHQQEFSHDLPGPAPKDQAFNGSGRALGGGGNRGTSKLLRMQPPPKKPSPKPVKKDVKKTTASSPIVIDDTPPKPKKKKEKKKPEVVKKQPEVVNLLDDDDDDDDDVEIVEMPKKKTPTKPKIPEEIMNHPSMRASRLKAEQDAEYEESLRADREKVRKQKEEAEEKQAAEDLDKAIEASRLSNEEETKKRKAATKDRLEMDRPNRTLNIRLRFPDGTTKTHPFAPSDPLSDVFDLAAVFGDLDDHHIDIVDSVTRRRLKSISHLPFSHLDLPSKNLSLLVIDDDA